MNIIGHRNIFLGISSILVLVSIVAIAVFGLRLGIDFVGGTLWQLRITRTDADFTRTNAEEIKNFFEVDLGIKNIGVFSAENQSFLIRLPHLTEEKHQKYLSELKDKFGLRESASSLRESAPVEELRFDTIGPAIGKELKQKALLAIVMVLFGISLYVTFAFRKVSYPVKSWKYGIITLITLFHDVIIPVGLFATLGYLMGVEVDINFVVAVLVVMGFSVHDTIVVFDRIRENLLNSRQKIDFLSLGQIINSSVNQTMARSINTSMTLILVLLAMFLLGPTSLEYFVLTMLVGVTVGTYSSIFVASPLLLLISGLKRIL
jgi:preprotein translocase subunit SecF